MISFIELVEEIEQDINKSQVDKPRTFMRGNRLAKRRSFLRNIEGYGKAIYSHDQSIRKLEKG